MSIGDSKIKHHESKNIAGLKFEEEVFTGNSFGNSFGDAKVMYHEHVICWISGKDIEAFEKKFMELIDQYRI